MGMSVEISSELLGRIRAEAAASPEREICGLLTGNDRAITGAIPAANVAPDPSGHFEIDPATLFVALRAERAGGARVIGHYHSHPNGRCEPSMHDAANAEPGKLWLIAAAGEIGLWRSSEQGFGQVELTVG